MICIFCYNSHLIKQTLVKFIQFHKIYNECCMDEGVVTPYEAALCKEFTPLERVSSQCLFGPEDALDITIWYPNTKFKEYH